MADYNKTASIITLEFWAKLLSKIRMLGAGKMVQKLRALAAPAEYWHLISSTCMATNSCLGLQFHRLQFPLLNFMVTGIHLVHRCTCWQNTHTHITGIHILVN